MSLRKSPTLTPALLEACRRNARKSTGPRTARGKAHVRMNALRRGGRSRLLEDFVRALYEAPPGGVASVVRQRLSPDLARHRLFTEWAELCIQADLPAPERLRWLRASLRRKGQEDWRTFFDQSGNVFENKDRPKTENPF